jgi:hypothetical protein
MKIATQIVIVLALSFSTVTWVAVVQVGAAPGGAKKMTSNRKHLPPLDAPRNGGNPPPCFPGVSCVQ